MFVASEKVVMIERAKPPHAWKAQTDQPRNITVIQEAIRKMHGCESKYCRTEHVVVAMDGKIAWDGFVMVFDLIGHREAECCYAWRNREGVDNEFAIVLKIPFFDSPESAVREWLDAAQRNIGAS